MSWRAAWYFPKLLVVPEMSCSPTRCVCGEDTGAVKLQGVCAVSGLSQPAMKM